MENHYKQKSASIQQLDSQAQIGPICSQAVAQACKKSLYVPVM